MFTTEVAIAEPRLMCPNQTARGSTSKPATITATTEIQTCSHNLTGIESGPDQVAGSVRNSFISSQPLIALSAPTG
jgi:hypothetical protein